MKVSLVLFIGFCLSFGAFAQTGKDMTLKREFHTDQCTGWLDGSFKYDWSECCERHDLSFWAGGTLKERNQTDLRLKQCVEEKANTFHAQIIYMGVRAGRYSPFKLEDKKWGNAWGDTFAKGELESREIDLLENSLRYQNPASLSDEEISKFIRNLRQRNK